MMKNKRKAISTVMELVSLVNRFGSIGSLASKIINSGADNGKALQRYYLDTIKDLTAIIESEKDDVLRFKAYCGIAICLACQGDVNGMMSNIRRANSFYYNWADNYLPPKPSVYAPSGNIKFGPFELGSSGFVHPRDLYLMRPDRFADHLKDKNPQAYAELCEMIPLLDVIKKLESLSK